MNYALIVFTLFSFSAFARPELPYQCNDGSKNGKMVTLGIDSLKKTGTLTVFETQIDARTQRPTLKNLYRVNIKEDSTSVDGNIVYKVIQGFGTSGKMIIADGLSQMNCVFAFPGSGQPVTPCKGDLSLKVKIDDVTTQVVSMKNLRCYRL